MKEGRCWESIKRLIARLSPFLPHPWFLLNRACINPSSWLCCTFSGCRHPPVVWKGGAKRKYLRSARRNAGKTMRSDFAPFCLCVLLHASSLLTRPSAFSDGAAPAKRGEVLWGFAKAKKEEYRLFSPWVAAALPSRTKNVIRKRDVLKQRISETNGTAIPWEKIARQEGSGESV